MRRQSRALGLAAIALLVAGCGDDGGYHVRIATVSDGGGLGEGFPDVVRVEISLIESCETQTLGGDPVGVVRQVEAVRGTPTPGLGRVEAGAYGLYARSLDAACFVVFAGCEDVRLGPAGEGTLTVTVRPLGRTSACVPFGICIEGHCLFVDSGPGGD